MITLSDRLKTIAGEIEKGETVTDIGTDHGFLPLYLWERGISPKVIMTDVSIGSLKKAEENCRSLYPDNNFDLRLGNGIEVIEKRETDVLVIAGMGGLLIADIISADIEKALNFKKIILQPRNNIGPLRHCLMNNGFSVKNHQLVREGKYICEVLTVIPKEVAITRMMGPERIEYQFPHSLRDFAGPLTEEYLKENLEKEKFILESMKKSSKITYREIRSQNYRIEYLERMIASL